MLLLLLLVLLLATGATILGGLLQGLWHYTGADTGRGTAAAAAAVLLVVLLAGSSGATGLVLLVPNSDQGKRRKRPGNKAEGRWRGCRARGGLSRPCASGRKN